MLTSGRHFDSFAQRSPAWVKTPAGWVVKRYRSMTSGLRTWPDFLIIGARRCGTTSLYNYLTTHPRILPALRKEVCFFNDNYTRGESWYRGHFPTAGEKWIAEARFGKPVITGEASPSYLSDPYLPERVYRLLPDVKLIIILRNPIDAAYSAYHFGLKLGVYTEDQVRFEDLVVDEIERAASPEGAAFLRRRDRASINDRRTTLLARYIYVDQLRFWFDVFPEDAIKVVIFEELIRNKGKQLKEIFQFLEVPPYQVDSFEQLNSCFYAPMNFFLREQMEEYFARPNHRLSDFLGKALSWEGTCLQGSGEIPTMPWA